MLNDKERKLVEENHNLIYSFCKTNSIDIEEYYDLMCISLCKASQSFKSEAGNFSTYAYRIMKNDYCSELENQKKFKRCANVNAWSLEYEYNMNDEESSINLKETLIDVKSQYEESDTSAYLQDIFEKANLTALQKHVLILYSQGYKFREIGEQLDVLPQAVNSTYNRALSRVRRYIHINEHKEK